MTALTLASTAPAEPPAAPAPDRQTLGYALGLNLALECKEAGIDLDADVVAKSVREALQGQPGEISESQAPVILKQAKEYARVKQSSKYIADGEAFLAKNAKEDGVTVLPDGVQYRVLTTGAGPTPKRSDILVLKFRGTWIDGTEFNRNDALDIPFFACTKGLQECLLRMPVGSKWRIFVPYNLGYGHIADFVQRTGSALIYDLELVSAESESARHGRHHGAGRIGHWLEEDLLPPRLHSSMDAAR